jgi:hypothetical protein
MNDSWKPFQKHCMNISINLMHKLTPDEKLMHKIINGGRTNLNEWFEKIMHDYIEEQAIEDRESVKTIKNKFYIELHDGFLCIVPSLLHKFLLDKGVRDIVEYRPLLKNPPLNSNWKEKQEEWEEFIESNCKDMREAWDYFLKK